MQRINLTELMKNQGFGFTGKWEDNSSYEARKAFETAVNNAGNLWEHLETKENKLSKENFVVCTTQFVSAEENKKSHYLRGLTSEHLGQLFDIYTHHLGADKKAMDATHFCHAFTFLCRDNIELEVAEISLAQSIELIHAAIRTYPITHPLCIARPKIAEELKKTGTSFILYINEGRSEVFHGALTTYGLNLIVAFNDKGNLLRHIPLITVLESQNASLHPALELNELNTFVSDLQQVESRDFPEHLRIYSNYLPKLSKNPLLTHEYDFNIACGADVRLMVEQWTPFPRGVTALVLSYYYVSYNYSYLKSIFQNPEELHRPMPLPILPSIPKTLDFKIDFSVLDGLNSCSIFQPITLPCWDKTPKLELCPSTVEPPQKEGDQPANLNLAAAFSSLTFSFSQKKP